MLPKEVVFNLITQMSGRRGGGFVLEFLLSMGHKYVAREECLKF